MSLKQDLLKKKSVLKLVPNAIHSILAVKSLPMQVDVWTASIGNTALNNNNKAFDETVCFGSVGIPA